MIGILGKKLGMSQIIQEDGKVVPVTYVHVLENEVLDIRTEEKNGYNALVLGIDPYNKPRKTKKYKHIKEVPIDNPSEIKLGQKITLKDLGECELVHITATSKGKGFQGPVRRWNRSIARKTHGTKFIRHGSTMSSSITGRSKPGIKMAGRMGTDKMTLRDRSVVEINQEKHIYAVKGGIPGAIHGLVILRKSI